MISLMVESPTAAIDDIFINTLRGGNRHISGGGGELTAMNKPRHSPMIFFEVLCFISADSFFNSVTVQAKSSGLIV